MKNIFKIMAMLSILVATTVSSLFILDIISLDIAKETIFKSVFVILILTISSLLTLSIMGKSIK